MKAKVLTVICHILSADVRCYVNDRFFLVSRFRILHYTMGRRDSKSGRKRRFKDFEDIIEPAPIKAKKLDESTLKNLKSLGDVLKLVIVVHLVSL